MIDRILHIKKSIYRLVVLILVICCALVLFGCEDKDGIVQNGITVSDGAKPYSEKTNQRASEVIFLLLEELYKSNGLPSLSTATKSELVNISEDIRELTIKNPVSEAQYNAVLDVLREKSTLVVEELSAAFGGDGAGGSLLETKSLYLAISKHTGADYVGSLLYNLCLYSYNYNYEKSMERYNKYGYPHLLIEANESMEKRDTLASGVGEANFITATKLGFMMSEVFLGGGFEDGRIQSFSNQEILIFLKHVKISSLTLTPDGWRLLSSYFIPSEQASVNSYMNMIIYTADKNGDLDELSESVSDLVSLFAYVQENLDEADAEGLRSGELSSVLSSAFSKFGEQEWEKFERLSSISLEKSAYEAICEEFYGENFKDYSLNIQTVTLEELKASVGSDSFTQKLEGYVAGISPAFSYWLHI